MRLLVLTQAVDLDDPVLGFFHGWIKKISESCELVHVVCLKEGEHRLPQNVRVHSLGKESGKSRAKYVARLYRYVFSLRRDYDAVFVHMNQEYVLLAGLFWRLLGKRIVLWRNHKKGTALTRIAGKIAHTVCYTSPEAYVAGYKNAARMPIGIDTDAFKPLGNPPRNSILFLGRLDPVKQPELFIGALDDLRQRGVSYAADIVGDPTPGREAYAEKIKASAAGNPFIRFHSSIRNDAAPAMFASHAIYVNLTPSGSFDKTIGEAMACGCIVVTQNAAVREVLPEKVFVSENTASAAAAAIAAAINMQDAERASAPRRSRAFIEERHSLNLLAQQVMALCV